METATIQANSHHEKHVINDKLCYFKPMTEHRQKSFADELSYSLRQKNKFISPKFFYNQKGSELFEQICNLPEYYLTRTEIGILSDIKHELQEFLISYNDNNCNFRLVELGSGASIKTRHLLDVLKKSQSSLEYIPIDISEFLESSTADLLYDYSDLKITGVIDTYENGLQFVKNYNGSNNLIAFFGSSLGNFPFKEGKTFLKTIYDSMSNNDLFLIGLDLVKDKSVLENAYDDSQGITAQFNLNVLARINNELDANFNLDNFSHHSVYNEKEERIEMYLRSLKDQSVSVSKANLLISFTKNELIHTENSHKFSISKINSLMNSIGFNILKLWQDSDNNFAVILLSKTKYVTRHI